LNNRGYYQQDVASRRPAAWLLAVPANELRAGARRLRRQVSKQGKSDQGKAGTQRKQGHQYGAHED
jgi:hypothetical protein